MCILVGSVYTQRLGSLQIGSMVLNLFERSINVKFTSILVSNNLSSHIKCIATALDYAHT